MPKTSQAHLKAIAKYQKTNTTQIKLSLNNKTDADIITKLDSVPNKQGYIKGLIRDDITEEESQGGQS